MARRGKDTDYPGWTDGMVDMGGHMYTGPAGVDRDDDDDSRSRKRRILRTKTRTKSRRSTR